MWPLYILKHCCLDECKHTVNSSEKLLRNISLSNTDAA